MLKLSSMSDSKRKCLLRLVGTVLLIILFYHLRTLLSKTVVDFRPESVIGFSSVRFGSTVRHVQRHSDEIPLILHQTWKTHKLSFILKPWISSCISKNADFEYWYWTDQDIRNFILDKYPDYLQLFDSYPTDGYRADAFRYFALHHYGGIYLDVDVECLQPFYNFTLEHSCFVSQEPVEHPHFLNRMDEPLVSNALMGCRPGHPFFEYVIRHLSDYTGWLFWTDILKATGPFMLTQAFKSFRNSNSHQQSVSKHDNVELIDDRIFQPTIDDSMLRHIVEKCRRPIEKRFPSAAYRAQHATLCSKLLSFQYANIPGVDSITNHHWTHLWGGRRYDPWGAFNTDIGFDIRQLAVLRNLSVTSP